MASPAQITASRANAQPPAGNALKLGITAQSMIIPGEDPAELELLTADHQQEFQPIGPVETALLETIIRSQWMQLRCDRIETAYFNARMTRALDHGPTGEDPLGTVVLHDYANGQVIHKIFIRRQAALRDWNRAVEQLYLVQAHRQRTESEATPAPVTPHSVNQSVPFPDSF